MRLGRCDSVVAGDGTSSSVAVAGCKKKGEAVTKGDTSWFGLGLGSGLGSGLGLGLGLGSGLGFGLGFGLRLRLTAIDCDRLLVEPLVGVKRNACSSVRSEGWA